MSEDKNDNKKVKKRQPRTSEYSLTEGEKDRILDVAHRINDNGIIDPIKLAIEANYVTRNSPRVIKKRMALILKSKIRRGFDVYDGFWLWNIRVHEIIRSRKTGRLVKRIKWAILFAKDEQEFLDKMKAYADKEALNKSWVNRTKEQLGLFLEAVGDKKKEKSVTEEDRDSQHGD